MWQWFEQQQALLFWLFVGSLLSLVLTAVLLPVVVLRLPADYFTREHHPGHGPRRVLDWIWHIAKNALGALFVLAGIAMLVLPGQGVLTIVIGVLLLDLPGKRAFERRLLCRPSILALVNRLRQKRGRPPLELGPG